MTDFTLLNSIIAVAKEEVDTMIKVAEKQGIIGFQIIYSLRDILDQLETKTTKSEKVDGCFIENWNSIYGKIFRGLEGTKLLDLIDKIDDIIQTK